MSKLIDSFPEYMTTGAIFTALGENYAEQLPWAESHGTALDVDYIGEHSGDKQVSVLVDKFIRLNSSQSDARILTESQIEKLADIIFNRYVNKWSRLYAVMESEYNPVQNYNMTEEETPNLTHTETPNITRGKTTTNKISVTVTGGNSQDDSVYGFNSSSAVPTGKVTGTNSSTTTANANDNVTTDSETETGTRTTTDTGKRTLTRSGNIGVTTTQQMLESEINLWEWNFFEQVFADVDNILTSKYYMEEY